MLANKRSVGVALEVNLRNPTLNLKANPNRSAEQGVGGPLNRTDVLQQLKNGSDR